MRDASDQPGCRSEQQRGRDEGGGGVRHGGAERIEALDECPREREVHRRGDRADGDRSPGPAVPDDQRAARSAQRGQRNGQGDHQEDRAGAGISAPVEEAEEIRAEGQPRGRERESEEQAETKDSGVASLDRSKSPVPTMPATDGVRIAPIARGIAISAAVAWNPIEYRAISLSFEKCARKKNSERWLTTRPSATEESWPARTRGLLAAAGPAAPVSHRMS